MYTMSHKKEDTKLMRVTSSNLNRFSIFFFNDRFYFGFVDLEKAFDRVPTKVISWAMRKLGVVEWLVSAVMSMYTGAKTVVRTVYGNSKGFEVKVGMHQGSGLSSLLFVIVMEAISRE